MKSNLAKARVNLHSKPEKVSRLPEALTLISLAEAGACIVNLFQKDWSNAISFGVGAAATYGATMKSYPATGRL